MGYDSTVCFRVTISIYRLSQGYKGYVRLWVSDSFITFYNPYNLWVSHTHALLEFEISRIITFLI